MQYPVDLGIWLGVAKNVCSTGIYFETSTDFSEGSAINFSIDFDSLGGKLVYQCQGTIVRVEQLEGKIGVAVKITESVMMAGGNSAPSGLSGGERKRKKK